MYFLGIDLGSSSIKLSVFDAERGIMVAGTSVPEFEMEIAAPQFGWAEQDPSTWWNYIKEGIKKLGTNHRLELKRIKGIGIAYQMHGLVLTDKDLNPVRPSIIWCDSRAAETGEKIFTKMGPEKCRLQILGSPGNFTASKLKWVQENEPEAFAKAAYMMLPGDFIASKFSKVPQTTASGLSEAALWNFSENKLAEEVLVSMELSKELIPEIVPNFGRQAKIHPQIADELGLNPETVICYRAGDQPNNAFSLNVLEPGEIATTAGTSAVIYAVTEKDFIDEQNRVNTFLHVNSSKEHKRNGVLLCINGSGILYQWLRKILSTGRNELLSYDLLNSLAAKVPPGSEDLRFYPFGNGVERIFDNKNASSGVQNLNFNIHQSSHLVRSACEGIVFAMKYGYEIMKEGGASGKIIRAGNANLFLSPVFREIFTNTVGATLEIYNSSGAEGAARGAAYGYGFYNNLQESMQGLKCLASVEPNQDLNKRYSEIYEQWKKNIKIDQN